MLELTGVPLVSKTNPPPNELDVQSPTTLVGKRSPSMPNPPVGGLTGAVPEAALPSDQAIRLTRQMSPNTRDFHLLKFVRRDADIDCSGHAVFECTGSSFGELNKQVFMFLGGVTSSDSKSVVSSSYDQVVR